MFNPTVQNVIDQVDALRDQVNDHWQIPRDEAKLLAQLVRQGDCRSICEIGTSYGFSTLHLAAATAERGGHVHTFDIDPKKVEAAGRHLDQAGLTRYVTRHLGDACEQLAQLTLQTPFDFVFIDATKQQSFDYLNAVWPHLGKRTTLVTDNINTHPRELAPFVEHLRNLPEFESCTVAIGNGFELSIRRGN